MADKIGYIEGKISRVFELWGFRRIVPPLLEFHEVLALGMGEDVKEKAFRFDDRQSGKLLAIPPDITPQVARIVATRLNGWPLPHRISYSGRVLRQTEIQAGRSREIFQSGVELIGLDSPEADAEMVAMAVEVLQGLGFDNFKIDMGQVEFCRGVMAASGLQGQPLRELQQAVARKDTSAVAKVLAENRAYLIQLDAAIGDADHGANMDRGFKAALSKLPTVADKDIGTDIVRQVGLVVKDIQQTAACYRTVLDLPEPRPSCRLPG